MEKINLKTNNCNDCVHLGVCAFRADKIDLTHKLKEKLNNECITTNKIFEFSFWCKQYINRYEQYEGIK